MVRSLAAGIYLATSCVVGAEGFEPIANVSELPAWQFQPPESVEEYGTVRLGSIECQMPVYEVPCMMFREPVTVEELAAMRRSVEELDAANELIDLQAIVDKDGYIPSMVWFH